MLNHTERLNEFFNHPNLKAFKEHGFLPEFKSGDAHVVGVCMFCGSYSSKSESGVKPSFHINVEEKKWDCKICGKNGGYQVFLREIINWAEEAASVRILRRLSDERGIRVSTLRAHRVGYNMVNKKFVLPVMDLENETILNIRHFKRGKNLRTTSGGNTGLYGGNVLNLSNRSEIDVVWLVEGHWDKMVMWEILRRLQIKNEVAVSVPGAQQFKSEWIALFRNKVVNVIYDNDHDYEVGNKTELGAGKKGMIKVYGMLKGQAETLNFVHWPSRFKSGFDIRDLYNRNNNSPRKTRKILINFLEDLPKDIEKSDAGQVLLKTENVYDGEGCPIEEVYEVFNKWLKLKNNDVIDMAYATIVANRLNGCPVWLFLVGPSGCGKSEVIMSFKDHKYIESISSLTANTLISGANFTGGNDPSLVPYLDKMVLAIKDYTAIMGLDRTTQIKIVSDLRDAFDGECAKIYGNGRRVKYDSKFGIIAGVTGMIDIASEGLTALGERFIRYIVPVDKTLKGERDVLRRVKANRKQGGRETMQKELRTIGNRFLNFDFGEEPEIPTEMENRLFALVQLTGILRASIVRDFRTDDISYKPMQEYCTRLADQFMGLAAALPMIKREKCFNMEHFKLLKYTAKGTIPSREEEVIRKLYKNNMNGRYTQDEISEMLRLPTTTTRKVIDNLTAFKALRKHKTKRASFTNDNALWSLHKKVLGLIEECEFYG